MNAQRKPPTSLLPCGPACRRPFCCNGVPAALGICSRCIFDPVGAGPAASTLGRASPGFSRPSASTPRGIATTGRITFRLAHIRRGGRLADRAGTSNIIPFPPIFLRIL